jgi:hypothetical protein
MFCHVSLPDDDACEIAAGSGSAETKLNQRAFTRRFPALESLVLDEGEPALDVDRPTGR